MVARIGLPTSCLGPRQKVRVCMKMDWEPTYQERFPEWRSSDGALKEEKSNGREALTGYESSDKEKQRRDEPKKIWEMGNSYGSFSVGKNKKKQLVVVNSQRRSKDLRALPEESKVLRGQTSVKMPLITGDLRFNEDWNRREKSAYGYRVEASRSPHFLMRKMEQLMKEKGLDVQKNINPFFSTEEEKKELAYLREQAKLLGQSRDRETEKGLRTRIQFLTTVVADKERQRLNFYNRLPGLMEEARKGQGEEWDFIRSWLEELDTETDQGDGGGQGQGQGQDQDQDQNRGGQGLGDQDAGSEDDEEQNLEDGQDPVNGQNMEEGRDSGNGWDSEDDQNTR